MDLSGQVPRDFNGRVHSSVVKVCESPEEDISRSPCTVPTNSRIFRMIRIFFMTTLSERTRMYLYQSQSSTRSSASQLPNLPGCPPSHQLPSGVVPFTDTKQWFMHKVQAIATILGRYFVPIRYLEVNHALGRPKGPSHLHSRQLVRRCVSSPCQKIPSCHMTAVLHSPLPTPSPAPGATSRHRAELIRPQILRHTWPGPSRLAWSVLHRVFRSE